MKAKTIAALATSALTLSLATSASAQFTGHAPADNPHDARADVYARLMHTRLAVEFNASPLRDVLEFLADYAEVDILTKWDDSGYGDGLDPEAQITLNLSSTTPIVTILELVMKQVTSDETSWNLGASFVEIGLKEKLILDKYTRIYPVRELLLDIPTFDNAPEMDLNSVLGGGDTGEITSTIFHSNDNSDKIKRVSDLDQADELIDIITAIVDPLQWERNGGDGSSIRYFKGSLIVNGPDFIHRQVGGYPTSVTQPRSIPSRFAALIDTPGIRALSGRFGFAKVIEIDDSVIPILVNQNRISPPGNGA